MPSDRDPLYAVSPLDGRYASRTAPLSEFVSEAALIRARIEVEVEYLIALADLDEIPLAIDTDRRADLRELYHDFAPADADLIKQIETTGAKGYPATNHDVKAVEYFLRESTPEHVHPWIHFGLTSEDVTNLAYRLLIRKAIGEVIRPALLTVRETLVSFAHQYADLPMLARTHGQAATPTTFGKEMAVFAARLGRTLGDLAGAEDSLAGKLAGATGTFGAHHAAFPDVDWQTFARSFVNSLGLDYLTHATQIHPGDDLAALFDALARVNRVLIDLDRDVWEYVSRGYLGQAAADDETGSSTMPHKVNPIDFENSEGNLSKASSDLQFLSASITTSRLQRDLSDSTVKRNVGAALAYCLLGYSKLQDGLETVVPNEPVMREDLRNNPAVVGEAVQTILRREGYPDAYERVKRATRGESAALEDFHGLIEGLDLPETVAEELRRLTPETYTGLADRLAKDVE